MADKGPVLPLRVAPPMARHVAAAVAAVQAKAGPVPGGRAPAAHVAAATAAVQRQPAAVAPRPSARIPSPQLPAPVQPKPAAVRLSPPALPARAPVPPAPPAVPAAARPSGPRSALLPGARIAQAKFPLEKHFGHVLSNHTLCELNAIQDLLKDRTRVGNALKYLESQIVEHMKGDDDLSPNAALNLALQDEEHRWMNTGRIKVAKNSTISRQEPKKGGKRSQEVVRFGPPEGIGGLSADVFVSRVLVPLRALKDVGANVHHGEYAHRLQWYIISFFFRQKFTADELRHLYLIMSAFVIDHPTEKARISLWDAVLDVQGSWATTEKVATQELYGGPDEVGFAVPGFLTGILTDDTKEPKAKVPKSYEKFLKDERWSKSFPNLSTAVTRRKLKRLA